MIQWLSQATDIWIQNPCLFVNSSKSAGYKDAVNISGFRLFITYGIGKEDINGNKRHQKHDFAISFVRNDKSTTPALSNYGDAAMLSYPIYAH
ncbi:MAG: hypothetical protein V7K55_06985 [Nostoc sp.]|uniref:hypothetical protein n=1 Tax=Nostoc sp. TaxID=1180 RepID=UPI002FF70768